MCRLFVASLIVGCAVVALGTSSQAATITWETPETCTAVSDIDNAGSLVEAINFGSSTSYTVNGVNFVANSVGNDSTYSNFSLLSANVSSGAFSGSVGDANYAAMLDSFAYVPSKAASTFTLQGLTIGQAYAVQLFVSDARDEAGFYTEAYAIFGDGASHQSGDVLAPVAGPGSYVIGTFTADAATQALSEAYYADYVAGGPGIVQPRLNAYELREAPAGVPEPNTLALLATGLLAPLAYAWRKRK